VDGGVRHHIRTTTQDRGVERIGREIDVYQRHGADEKSLGRKRRKPGTKRTQHTHAGNERLAASRKKKKAISHTVGQRERRQAREAGG